jgi:prepilin-type N-terminal cleavage/methylation domain-containing protein
MEMLYIIYYHIMEASKMKLAKRSNQAGFTFIEIIIVLVILGIIAAIAVPKFLSITEDAKKVASDGTYGAMKSACSMAFAKHRAGQLEKSASGDDQYITDADSLEYYLDGGFPDGVTGSSKTVTLQDKTVVTVTAETNDTPASLSRK